MTLIARRFIKAGDLIPIFRIVPNLTELCFKISYDFEAIFKFLTFGCNGKFHLGSVKALGIHMAVKRYRMSQPGEEEDVDSWHLNPLLPFPYKALEDLVASRIQTFHRGDFRSIPYTITPLQHLVTLIRTDEFDWAGMARKIREDVQPFSVHGLTVGGIWV